MTSLFVNRLTTLDFSYFCPVRGLVGETWIVDAILTGELNDQGMVFDFGHVKKQIKSLLDALSDHKLLIPVLHSDIEVVVTGDRIVVQLFSSRGAYIECKAPAKAVFLIDADVITPDTVTPILERALINMLPDNVSRISLQLYPEAIDGAYYHYSHGLKKHSGDCQRIAHGHRSKIIITVDGIRSCELESVWSKRWQDIYIATEEDLLETYNKDNYIYHRFGYTSTQGYFELTIESIYCYFINTDSTVELLAEHAARRLAAENSGSEIQVTAYEGLDKGAISKIACHKV